MKVVFRVDASVAIGSGHVMRTLTLARELAARGAHTRFVCREHPGHMGERIAREGHELHLLPAPDPATHALTGYSRWLGVEAGRDVEEFLAAATDFRADWLVVDHYALDADWERRARPAARSILAIDDLANRPHDCDLLLDQNFFGARTAERYGSLLPAAAVRLLGPSFALLRAEFHQLRLLTRERDGMVRRILVYFGASDLHNQTARVLEALTRPGLRHLAVDVVVGLNHPDPEGLTSLAAQVPDARTHRDLPSLALLMAGADLAIGAGGSTTWERACLGLPSLVQVAAENQRDFTRALSDAGLQLDAAENSTVAAWGAAIEAALADASRLARISGRVREITDGLGAARVAAAMEPEKPADLRLMVRRENEPARGKTAALCEVRSGLEYCRARLNEHPEHAEVESLVTAEWGDAGALRRSLLARMLMQVNSCLSLAGADHARSLRLTLLTDRGSWVNPLLESFAERCLDKGHRVRWVHEVAALQAGDVCFVLSFSALLRQSALALHRHNLVVHASALPQGRGWSPMTWQILEGRNEFTLTLFEATAQVDAGVIYAQQTVTLAGHELADEWRRLQVEGIAGLCAAWLDRYPASVTEARAQHGEPSFYGRRTPADSALDVHAPIESQFDLLRVADNQRYPAWFEFRGHRYILTIKEKS